MAKIIYPDGTSKEVTPANGKYFSLKEKQDIVGGLIEICETADPDGEHCLIINEEGKLMNLEFNPIASAKYRYWSGMLDESVIVGTVLYGLYEEMFEEDYKAARRAERESKKK